MKITDEKESINNNIDESAIIDEVNRLNQIKEPNRFREPANRNSILHSPIAKATRKLLKEIKEYE